MENELLESIAACASILASVFSEDPAKEAGAVTVDGLATMKLKEEWPFGDRQVLSEATELIAAGSEDSASLRDEWKRQFVGPGHFEAPQWASVYLDPDEVVFGNAHLELRQWMRTHGIEAHQEQAHMPDDSFGKEMALLAWTAEHKPELVKDMLALHILPWASRYLKLLEETSKQPYWKGMALLSQETLRDMADVLDVHPESRKLYH